jgi:hypothetical protein
MLLKIIAYCRLLKKKFNNPIIFCRTYWNCAGPEFTKFENLNGIGDAGNNKNLTRHVFKYKHMKWSRWCITVSLNYKNTMINRITTETVACLRSKCHLKQNLIPSWPWSFRHTSCISDFQCKTKFVGHPDRHTWQYNWSLWFSARSVRWISKSLILAAELFYICFMETGYIYSNCCNYFTLGDT